MYKKLNHQCGKKPSTINTGSMDIFDEIKKEHAAGWTIFGGNLIRIGQSESPSNEKRINRISLGLVVDPVRE